MTDDVEIAFQRSIAYYTVGCEHSTNCIARSHRCKRCCRVIELGQRCRHKWLNHVMSDNECITVERVHRNAKFRRLELRCCHELRDAIRKLLVGAQLSSHARCGSTLRAVRRQEYPRNSSYQYDPSLENCRYHLRCARHCRHHRVKSL